VNNVNHNPGISIKNKIEINKDIILHPEDQIQKSI
jgi:hypothetical protein